MSNVEHSVRGAATPEPAGQYAALRHAASAVARGVDPQSVFALLAEGAARLVGGDGAGLVRFDSEGRGRLIGQWSREGLLDGPIPRDIALAGGSAISSVYRTGEPARVDDYSALDEDRGQYLASAYVCGVAVPIRLGIDVWGALSVASAEPDGLDADAETVLGDYAELVALAVASPAPGSRAGIEALLDTLLVSAPVGIAFLDRDLRLVRVNVAFARVTGLREDQHAGLDPAATPDRYPHLDLAALQRVRAADTPVLGVERTGISAAEAGGERHWLTSYYPVWPMRGGPPVGVGVIVVDLTEQRQDAEALRRERDYSDALIDAMQDGLAVAALDGTITDVNARFCEMTGFARDELLGRSPPYPYWGEGADAERARVAHARALAGRPGENALEYRRRDGRRLPVLVTHAQLSDAYGAVSGLVATVRDVTDLRRAEEERTRLFAAEHAARNRTEILQQVSAALSNALTPEHVLETTVLGTVPLVGAVGATVFLDDGGQLAPVARRDRRMGLLVDGPFAAGPDSVFGVVVREGAPVFLGSRTAIAGADRAADRAVRADAQSLAVVQIAQRGTVIGALALGFAGVRDFEPEDRALLVTIGDLCAQALNRARLYDAARARADAMRQRDAIRTAVLRGVSHEFRTPLTAIANAADALARVEDPELRQELLAVVGSETRRLDRFVANVLDFSRLEGGALEPRMDSCAVDEIVAGALEAVHALVGDLGVRVDIPGDVALVRADPVLTERILLNLVHNAARHGGPTIELAVGVRDDQVRFAVSDDGSGIPAAARRTLFEPFTGQRERGGLGLGLSLSRGLAEAQGGALWLDEATPLTRFVLALPRDAAEYT